MDDETEAPRPIVGLQGWGLWLTRVMSGLCALTALVAVAGFLLLIFATPPNETTFGTNAGTMNGPQAKAAAVILIGPSLALLLWGLYNAHLCFRGMARGGMFARPTVAAFRNFALGMLGYKAAPYVFGVLAFLVATHGNVLKPAAHGVSWTFDPLTTVETLVTLVFLGAIAVIAGVMAKATEIAEDNAQIV